MIKLGRAWLTFLCFPLACLNHVNAQTEPANADGARIVQMCTACPIAITPDIAPTMGGVKLACDCINVTITQVTHSGGFSVQSSISQDGHRIAFVSDHNPIAPYSHNPNNRVDVFLAIQNIDWSFIKVSRPLSGDDNDIGSSSSPSISANGNRIAFASYGNFVGQNANHLPQIYLAQVNDQGQLVTLDQITNTQSGATPYTNIEPSLSDTTNGIRLAFVSDQDPASGTVLSHPEIFVWQKIGPSVNFRRVTNSPDATPCSNRGPSIGPNLGLRVAFSSDCNVTNDPAPTGFRQIYLATVPTTDAITIDPITATAGGSDASTNIQPSLADINTTDVRIAYVSDRAPNSTDAFGKTELFLAQKLGAGSPAFTRITTSVGNCNNRTPSLNLTNGRRMAFTSDCDHTGQNPDHFAQVFFARRDDGLLSNFEIFQITPGRRSGTLGDITPPNPSINGAGTRIAFDFDPILIGTPVGGPESVVLDHNANHEINTGDPGGD